MATALAGQIIKNDVFYHYEFASSMTLQRETGSQSEREASATANIYLINQTGILIRD
jgi:hypothetical protein